MKKTAECFRATLILIVSLSLVLSLPVYIYKIEMVVPMLPFDSHHGFQSISESSAHVSPATLARVNDVGSTSSCCSSSCLRMSIPFSSSHESWLWIRWPTAPSSSTFVTIATMTRHSLESLFVNILEEEKLFPLVDATGTFRFSICHRRHHFGDDVRLFRRIIK